MRRSVRGWRQRHHQPCGERQSGFAHLRYADLGCVQGENGAVRETLAWQRLCRDRKRIVLPSQHHDAARQRQEDGRAHHQGAVMPAAEQSPHFPLFLLGVVSAVFIWSGINPYERVTWWMEVAPVVIAVPLLLCIY